MDNPLKQFGEVEERVDGVYFKVTRDAAASVQMPQLTASLDAARIVNYNAEKIQHVVYRARGAYELIGPPFEYYGEVMDRLINVAMSPMGASIQLSSEMTEKQIRPTVPVITHRLARAGVKFGIRESVVEDLVKNPVYDANVVVAVGKKPKEGKNGELRFEVDVKPDSSPKAGMQGKVDYRNIQTFASVAKDQVIAVRTPPEPGIAGITITGQELPAPEGSDVDLPCGKNTRITDDGERLVADISGVAFLEGNLVCVEELLHVSGDVDYSTGNIKYTGDVVIAGNVRPGFVVETEGNIAIGGEVEAAKIVSRNGIVTVNHGIIGKGETFIYGKEGVHVGFAQEATVQTDGWLTIDKYCLHCSCQCGYLKSTDRNTAFVGGKLVAFEYVEIQTLGNDKNVATQVSIVSKHRMIANEKLKELAGLREKVEKAIEPVRHELKGKSSIIRKAKENVTSRHKDELRKVLESYNNLNMKLRYIERKTMEIEAEIQNPTCLTGYVRVPGKTFPGVELDLYDIGKMRIVDPLTNKVFRLQLATGEVVETGV